MAFKNLFFALALLAGNLCAIEDPLPSWNEGTAKENIIKFVKAVTEEGGSAFVPVKDRIAAFDEDGTLWVEQPLYTEFFYVLDNIKELSKAHPSWEHKEPFKSIIAGQADKITDFEPHDAVMLVGETHAGMSIHDFHERVKAWLQKTIHPRFKRPFTELVYQPMLEVMRFLKNNQFQVYIVSGGGQEFMRAFAENLYELPPGHIIGSAGKVKYEYRDGHPILMKLPEILYIDDKQGKPEGINLVIGKRPIAAFGNSIGDQQMLEWTQGQKGPTLEYLVHHDDPVREYAYGPDSKIGTFSNALMDEAKKQGWTVISMKNDWKVIFSWQNQNASGQKESNNP